MGTFPDRDRERACPTVFEAAEFEVSSLFSGVPLLALARRDDESFIP